MEGLIIIPIIIAAVALLIHMYLAAKFEQIAFAKGYDKSIHSFAMCFWLGIIGYIYVAALPTKVKLAPTHKEEPKFGETKESGPATIGGTKKDIYRCKSIVVTQKFSFGTCPMCGETCETLTHCKITNDVGVREFPICDRCIDKFKN